MQQNEASGIGVAMDFGPPAAEKPWRMTEAMGESVCIARLPSHLRDLQPPMTLLREFELPEEPPDATPKPPVLPRLSTADRRKMQWKLTDRTGRSFVGRREAMDLYSHFYAVDHGSWVEVIPVESWNTFSLEASQQPSGDAAERRKRMEFARDRLGDARIARMAKHRDSDEEARQGESHGGPDAEETPLLGEDLGFDRLRAKKAKKMRKLKFDQTGLKTRADEVLYDSAVQLGHLKKAAVDWDFAEDGIASDDEDSVGEKDADERDPEDDLLFESSDDDDMLTTYGQKVNQLLADQKEKEADDELDDKFSDDEDEEMEEEEKSEASSGVPKETAAASGAAVAKQPPTKTPQPEGLEQVKQRIVRMLMLHGGRMPVKKFMQQMGLTQKGAHFALVQEALNAVCEAHSEWSGEPPVETKVLELRAQCRPR